jgi:hypothetical protein
MMHSNRCWGVGVVSSAEELATMLTEQVWTLCSGFYVAGHPDYLFLNDATHADGASEYAVLKGGISAPEHLQIESITMSWCSYAEALAFIRQALAGEMDGYDFVWPVHPKLEPSELHGRCHLCA